MICIKKKKKKAFCKTSRSYQIETTMIMYHKLQRRKKVFTNHMIANKRNKKTNKKYILFLSNELNSLRKHLHLEEEEKKKKKDVQSY